MKRREFITLLGSAAASWPLAAHAQQPALPVIGFLNSQSPDGYAHFVAAFRVGLGETGYVEDQNVAIEYRWAGGQYDQVPAMASELVRRRVAVIVANTDAVFATLLQLRAGGLVIATDGFFISQSERLAALTVRHAVPTIFAYRAFVASGGLMSYGTSLADAYRLVGIYTGRILKGEKPTDLPVQQSTKVELFINLKTAKTLGLTVPTALLVRADEVIE